MLFNVPLGDAEFAAIQRIMQEASGIHLGVQKRSLVANRLQSRLQSLGLGDFRIYLQRVQRDVGEHQQLIDVLTTNETRFFREPRHFDLLRDALPTARTPLRVWSAACSSGQEAYSIAMLLAEALPNDHWEIQASDLSQRMLRMAETAIYPEKASSDIPRPYLVRYCRKGVDDMAGFFQISPELRRKVGFSNVNLMRPLPESLGRFDVIFLRNVLIYFNPVDKLHILKQVASRLREGGLLFVGHSESLHGLALPLRLIAPAVYRKTGSLNGREKQAL